jgi:hypothetical protein
VTSGTEQNVGAAPAGPPSSGRTGGTGQSLSLAKRFLTLREGSIILVTLVTLLYFAVSSDVISR